MPDGATTLQLVLGGDPALYSIVALSLYVSLCAVALAAVVALPFGAFLALVNFPGRTFIVVVTTNIGANLEPDDRADIDTHFHTITRSNTRLHPCPTN